LFYDTIGGLIVHVHRAGKLMSDTDWQNRFGNTRKMRFRDTSAISIIHRYLHGTEVVCHLPHVDSKIGHYIDRENEEKSWWATYCGGNTAILHEEID
jgi:hypothetical protein